jgi:uncharacterized membrane protein YhiD involved in acid resistance
MTLVTKEMVVTVPSGAKATVEVPADLDAEVVRLTIQAVLGTLIGLSAAQNERLKRTHLISFATGVASVAEITIKKVVFTNQTTDEDMSHIIENLLKSIGRDPPKGGSK